MVDRGLDVNINNPSPSHPNGNTGLHCKTVNRCQNSREKPHRKIRLLWQVLAAFHSSLKKKEQNKPSIALYKNQRSAVKTIEY
ncbi:hypothetical protein SPOG_02213 [Schizosaccharomyces cryophilus OY26]|uniref:Uncharacterized protein n=1 Tax=Schizosaccharomyces cryophilus (strain OY26 / ATCC MYA-4695 / CBS 11777 / NBRC 106824 / NRRL Y48691) TaxID=653667 RepID=S9VSI2_SCHCR|nr:uncharacterized protein SPOG_02213 [Schizosaccharomyces cryophilus OY26]EPY49149.1 hypothetical protein SPOG_02213 [Schizosaccharomyces cryophilus OY26]